MKCPILNKLRSQRAFTLTELIIVFAILGLLSLILIPQVSLYVTKAMGTTALTDSKVVMAAALTHNLTNKSKFAQKDLDKRMGLVNGKDTGAGKTMGVVGVVLVPDPTAPADATKATADYVLTYRYERGGVTLQGIMYIMSQNTTWSVSGLDATKDAKRIAAIEDGLKITRGTLKIGLETPPTATPGI